MFIIDYLLIANEVKHNSPFANLRWNLKASQLDHDWPVACGQWYWWLLIFQKIQNLRLTKAFQNVFSTTKIASDILKSFQGYQYTLLHVLATFMTKTIHSVITVYCLLHYV